MRNERNKWQLFFSPLSLSQKPLWSPAETLLCSGDFSSQQVLLTNISPCRWKKNLKDDAEFSTHILLICMHKNCFKDLELVWNWLQLPIFKSVPFKTDCLLLSSAWCVRVLNLLLSYEAQLWHFQLHSTISFILNVISGSVLIVFD